MSYCNSLTVVVSDITWFMAVEVDTAHISGFSLYLDCYWNLYAIIQLEWAGIRCAEHISCDRWSYHLNMYMIKDSDSPEKTVHIRQWVKRVHGPDIFMVNRDGDWTNQNAFMNFNSSGRSPWMALNYLQSRRLAIESSSILDDSNLLLSSAYIQRGNLRFLASQEFIGEAF